LKTYETVIVIDSLLKNEEIDEIVNKVERVISNNGGIILNIDRWGKKRLAYEIKKRQYGYYVEIDFDAPPNLIHILEREYRLEENILRYLSVHLNKKALEYRERQKVTKVETVADAGESSELPINELSEDFEVENSAFNENEANAFIEPPAETKS
jgi:small subunit ribosomal protein S6